MTQLQGSSDLPKPEAWMRLFSVSCHGMGVAQSARPRDCAGLSPLFHYQGSIWASIFAPFSHVALRVGTPRGDGPDLARLHAGNEGHQPGQRRSGSPSHVCGAAERARLPAAQRVGGHVPRLLLFALFFFCVGGGRRRPVGGLNWRLFGFEPLVLSRANGKLPG